MAQVLKPTGTAQADKRALASGKLSSGKPVDKLPKIDYSKKK